MAPKLTIITPVYNAEGLLGRALASLQSQTLGFENLRWVLVDDQSTDGSFSLIQGWARQYPNITVLQTAENSGSAAAPRNLALGRVDTPYVMFLDNDDAFAPDACRALVDAAERTGADLVSGYFQDVDADGAPLGDRHPSCGPAGQPDRLYRLPKELEAAAAVQGIFWCKLYRMELILANAVTFPTDTLMEDSVFFAKYLLCCRTMFYTDALVYRFSARGDSLSRTPNARYVLSRAVGYDHLFALYAGQPAVLRLNLENVAAHFLPLIFSSPDILPEERPALLRAWRRAAAYSLREGLCPDDPVLKKLMELTGAGRVDAALAVGELLESWRAETGRRDELFLAADRNWKAVCAENEALKARLAEQG